MQLKIAHETRYEFEGPVSYSLHQLRLVPLSRAGQSHSNWQIEIEGGTEEARFFDQFNNETLLISAAPDASRLSVHARGEVETQDVSGVVGPHDGPAPLWLFRNPTALTRPGPSIRKIAQASSEDSQGDVPRLHHLMGIVAESVKYETGATDVSTTAEQAAAAGSGVCQDHAHIFVAAARLLGYPARYVSGYLMMNDRVEQAATHAWAEVHLEALGWIGFDPSNAISPDARYVAVATGCDYLDAAPISGLIVGGNTSRPQVTVQVQQ